MIPVYLNPTPGQPVSYLMLAIPNYPVWADGFCLAAAGFKLIRFVYEGERLASVKYGPTNDLIEGLDKNWAKISAIMAGAPADHTVAGPQS